MRKINEFILWLDQYMGGHAWFVYFLLGTGLFFTIYLGFPQIRYFRHAIRVVLGKFDKKTDIGDTSHFQALATALSGTVGTGNIAGVALAIHLGGPAALFWMLVTALIGMCTKFVEVLISHKYRDILPDGSISGGPMYYMKKKLNITTKSGKIIKTGVWLGSFFAFAAILSSFGTGCLPQVNSIADALFSTWSINRMITGGVLAIILALIIIGGIKRIAKVSSALVPAMAIIYFIGSFIVIATNYQNIIPSFISVFHDAFTGSAAVGGFLGASFAFSFNRGVNRGLFSNEAGQGSAPIAHSAARAHEPVSEGVVAILEPFIDTIIICMLTGMVLLSSGAWNEKLPNRFEDTDMMIVSGYYNESHTENIQSIQDFARTGKGLPVFTGQLQVSEGKIQNDVTVFHAQSIGEEITVKEKGVPFNGLLDVKNGHLIRDSKSENVKLEGKSLLHSATLTTEAFTRSILGQYGKYIVAIGLLLFAFSTVISWSYYGSRAVTYLWGVKYDIHYKIVYVIGFFLASFTDTTIIWNLSYITIAIMTIPNLLGLCILHKDVKNTIKDYWVDFKGNWPDAKLPWGEKNHK